MLPPVTNAPKSRKTTPVKDMKSGMGSHQRGAPGVVQRAANRSSRGGTGSSSAGIR